MRQIKASRGLYCFRAKTDSHYGRGNNMAGQISCDYCNNLVYDEEMEEYVCDVNMDEDDYARFCASEYKNCPYYQSNDEYKIVRHQM